MRRTIHFVRNFALIIILFVVLYSYAMFQGGFVSWFLFFGFLPIFLYHLGLLFYPIHRWKVSRSLSHQTIQAGERMFITIEINHLIPFPLYYCVIEDDLPQTLHKVDSHFEKYTFLKNPEKLFVERQMKKVIFPWFKKHIRLSYELTQIPRGEHQLQTIRISTGDVFGLIQKEYQFQVKDKFLVFPNQWKVDYQHNIGSFQHGSTSSHKWNISHTNVAVSIREYTPGDKYSWIDWKQTAKKNTMMTKEFEQEKDSETLIILDGCRDETLNLLAFEGTIELVNSFIDVIGKNSPESSLLLVSQEVNQFQLSTDVAKIDHVRYHLAQFKPASNRSFTVQIQERLSELKKRFVIILVTTQLEDSLLHTIQQLKHQSHKIHVFMIEAKEHLTHSKMNTIRQLHYEGITVSVLTERELTRNVIEVSV